MNKYIERITDSFVEQGIISQNSAAWFQYGLEKRLTTLMVGIPCVALALLLTDIPTALSFFLSFCLLRGRTNGYHAKTPGRCLITSLALEAIWLGLLCRFLNCGVMLVVLAVSGILIFLLAPYEHPAMHLNREEVAACRKSAHIRVAVLEVVGVVCSLLQRTAIARGLTLGIALASFLLVLAYIMNGGTKNEQLSRQGEKDCNGTGQSYDRR